MEYSITDFLALSTHSAPPGRLPVERAHRVMQMHTDCSTDNCPNKRAAYDALVRAGHLVPDSCRRPS
ncbi:hypothetical protein ACWDSJ_24170 [Nocardia sp. NPDC003482]|uniref:hypothetical protein n=1 Tax=Nocardia sp. NPDC004068 TaxID=3364303 RepID=UPI0036B4973E